MEQVRDGTTLRTRLLMPDGEHQIVNIALAGVRSPRVASKPGESSETWGEEVGYITTLSCTLLWFLLMNICLGRPSSSLSLAFFNVPYVFKYCLYRRQLQHHSKPAPLAVPPQQLASLLAKVRSNAKFFTLQNSCLRSVLHPAGNVAEFLVAAGLARIVDWHAGMLSSSGGMERLRAAEKAAKEKRACLYAGVASSTSKTNGGAADGNKRVFEATVIRVWNGDQISVVEKDTGKERKLQLSSTRGPK